MGVKQFIGARYVPKFSEPIEWSSDRTYEAIEVVMYQGASYISKQPVPVGVEITNTEFWLHAYDFNAQFEQLRQTVETYDGRISANAQAAADAQEAAANAVTVAEAIADTVPKPTVGVFAVTQPKWHDADQHELWYSADGKHFDFVCNTNTALNGINSNALFKWGEWYYHSNGDLCRRSKDLVNWANQQRIAIDKTPYPDGRIWAGTFFTHPVENKTYFLASREYQQTSTTDYNQTKALVDYFDIVAVEVTQDADTGALSVVPNSQFVVISGGGGSKIDPYCVYASKIGCVFACKDNMQCKLEFYTGATLRSLQQVNTSNPMVGVEAPQLVTNGIDSVGVYAEAYYPHTIGYLDDPDSFEVDGNQLPRCIMYAPVFVEGTSKTTYLWTVCDFPSAMAHPGMIQNDPTMNMFLNEHKPIRTTQRGYDKKQMNFTPPSGVATKAVMTNIPQDCMYTFGGLATGANAFDVVVVQCYEGTEPFYYMFRTPQNNVPRYQAFLDTAHTAKIATTGVFRNEAHMASYTGSSWVLPNEAAS